MYRLKRLRELIELKESTWDNIEEKRLRLLRWQELGDGYKVKALADYIATTLAMVKNYDTEINSIIENLKKHSKQKDLLEALKSCGAEIVLFIDELHMLVGAGGQEGTADAANLLKPALARGELQCLGATTFDEYASRIEPDPALERRFQKITIDEPSVAEAIAEDSVPKEEEVIAPKEPEEEGHQSVAQMLAKLKNEDATLRQHEHALAS